MHSLLTVVAVVALIALIWLFSPRGYASRRMNTSLNGWARRREEQGKGNFLTRPLWGDRDRWRPKGTMENPEADRDQN